MTAIRLIIADDHMLVRAGVRKLLELIEGVDVVAETGVQVFSFGVDPRASLVDPTEHAAVLRAVRDAVPVARRLRGAHMILASGFRQPGQSDAECRAHAVKALREACRIAADGGATILLEPVHMVVQGNPMAVRNVRQGLDVVEEVGHPALKVLADLYHNGVDGRSFEDAFADRVELVGHLQVADVEGRHEPGTGSLPWPTLVPLLRRRGYPGPMGLEYVPSRPIDESLALTRRTLDL